MAKVGNCLKKYLVEQGYKLEAGNVESRIYYQFIDHFFSRNGINEHTRYNINIQGRLDYFDFIELREARQSAKDAKKDALNAIRLTIAGLVISIALGIYSIILGREANEITSGQTITEEEKNEERKKDYLTFQLTRESIQLQREQISKTDSLIKVQNQILKKLNSKK